MRDLGDILYLGQVAELKTICEADGMLTIGAGVTLNDAYRALMPTLSAVVDAVAALCLAAYPQ